MNESCKTAHRGNALIGNANVHLRNWPLIDPDRLRAALAQAYDPLSTMPNIPHKNAALRFSRTRRFDEFNADVTSRLAPQALLPERLGIDAVQETVALFASTGNLKRKTCSLPPRSPRSLKPI